MSTELIVCRALRELGVSPSLRGYDAIKLSVLYGLEDRDLLRNITRQLYPKVAQAMNSTSARIERNVRHAVESVFSNTDRAVLYKYFGNTQSLKSGKLTNSQFVSGLVEYIVLEVNHD